MTKVPAILARRKDLKKVKQKSIDDNQESLSKLFNKPKRYSPIFVYSAKIEEEGKNYGKATISNLVVIPEATGFIDDSNSGGNEIIVQGPNSNPSKFIFLNFRKLALNQFISYLYKTTTTYQNS